MTKSQKQAIDADLAAISEGLQTTRLRLGLSVSKVAKEAGVARDTVTSVERGKLGNVGTLARHMAVLGYGLRMSMVGR